MKVAVKTVSGSKLVGDLVTVDYLVKDSHNIFGNGIWIKREKHITFLSDLEIRELRLAKENEREV